MAERVVHPLALMMWHEHRTWAWLASQTGYSAGHLRLAAYGHRRAEPRLRYLCSLALHRKESELFVPEETR